jgi:alpha-tubulin suppressor-like RCC1 family protein
VARLDASVEVAAGNRHACAVLGDTNVACWGKDLLDRPTRVLGLSDVLHLRCGGRHSCVLRNDGGVSCWGEDDRGQLGTTTRDAALVAPVEGLPPTTWISAGTAHSCAVLATDGSVWCWGDNTYGQLGQGRSDREPQARPVRVPSLPPCVQVEAGDKTTFVRTRDGHVYGWGFGIKRPVRLAIEGVTGIGAGGKQNCAIDDQGSVWCWGFNDFGQLGRSTEQDSATPVRVQVPSRATLVVVGDVHVCALVDAGAVVCWGSNEQGQLGIGASDRERHPGPERVRIEGCP